MFQTVPNPNKRRLVCSFSERFAREDEARNEKRNAYISKSRKPGNG